MPNLQYVRDLQQRQEKKKYINLNNSFIVLFVLRQSLNLKKKWHRNWQFIAITVQKKRITSNLWSFPMFGFLHILFLSVYHRIGLFCCLDVWRQFHPIACSIHAQQLYRFRFIQSIFNNLAKSEYLLLLLVWCNSFFIWFKCRVCYISKCI